MSYLPALESLVFPCNSQKGRAGARGEAEQYFVPRRNFAGVVFIDHRITRPDSTHLFVHPLVYCQFNYTLLHHPRQYISEYCIMMTPASASPYAWFFR
jgi:hypothetical protein